MDTIVYNTGENDYCVDTKNINSISIDDISINNSNIYVIGYGYIAYIFEDYIYLTKIGENLFTNNVFLTHYPIYSLSHNIKNEIKQLFNMKYILNTYKKGVIFKGLIDNEYYVSYGELNHPVGYKSVSILCMSIDSYNRKNKKIITPESRITVYLNDIFSEIKK